MAKLTILATPINAVGHVLACAGALATLAARGHRVIFVVDEVWRGKLSPLYEDHIYSLPKDSQKENAGEAIAKMFLEGKIIGDFTAKEKMANMAVTLHSTRIYEEIAFADRIVQQCIDQYRPDVIYFDGTFLSPSIYFSGIPWILNVSAQPLCCLSEDDIPPGGFGLPTNGSHSAADFTEYREIMKQFRYSAKYNDFLESIGYARYPDDSVMPRNQILTVYGYPEELNYPSVRRQNWFNIEVFNREVKSATGGLEGLLPKHFSSDDLNGRWSGKWILVTLGSMASVDLTLMKKLVAILSKTPHKYIVSKGPRHEEFELAANMWGDRFVDQLKIVPNVDLVISHGGNNTVTETFAQGKPLVILPLFGDQFDNAQRLEETGFGVRLETYKFTDEQMLNAIEKLLHDDQLHQKLAAASKRILQSTTHDQLADRIEQLLAKVEQ